jgi:hypothetical protein
MNSYTPSPPVSFSTLLILIFKNTMSYLNITHILRLFRHRHDDTSSRVNLDTLPILVLKNITSYLDVGHVLPLTQVNHSLRDALRTDNGFWLRLISGLKVNLTRQKGEEAFNELLRRLRTYRCNNCRCMEHQRRPFFEAFWNWPLCDHCRWLDQYRLITAFTAKRNYFLTEDDLLPLRTISKDNPRYVSGGHVRYFSRVSVKRRSDAILNSMGTTRRARLIQQRDCSERARDNWIQSVERRRQVITTVLTSNGFPNAENHYCEAVDAFVRRCWIDYPARVRWTAEDVLDSCANHME